MSNTFKNYLLCYGRLALFWCIVSLSLLVGQSAFAQSKGFFPPAPSAQNQGSGNKAVPTKGIQAQTVSGISGVGTNTQVQPSKTIVRPTFDLGPGGKLTIKDSAFKNGSAAIEPAIIPWFEALGEYLKARPELEVEIRGHASSEGDPATNQRLSEERAATARKYLVDFYGIAESRIRIRGFGDKAPLLSNDNERGRAQNRRVEIVGLSSATQKSLTTESGTAASGDGRVTSMLGRVQIRAPWELDFHNTHVGERIFEYHRIVTGENSRAEITFFDSSKIQVYENTSMIIYSPSSGRSGDKPRENVKLIEGNLFVKLNGNDSAGTSPFLVQTTQSSISLDTSSARIGIDSGGRSTVSVFGGTAKVRLNDTTQGNSELEVGEGFGVALQQGGGSSKRRIPSQPELLSPDLSMSETLVLPTPVIFQWSRRAPLTRLEIAADAGFAQVLTRQVFSKNDSLAVKLDSGTYYFRLTSIDEFNIESKPIEGSFMVGGAGARPLFRIAGFILFLIAAALVWASVLANTPFQVRTIRAWAVENQTLQFSMQQNSSYLLYRFLNWTLDHRSLLLIMRSLAALSFLLGMYIVWQ